MIKRLLKSLRNRILRNKGLKPAQASLGAQVRVIGSYINRGEIGTIVDFEHTNYPMIQFTVLDPYRMLAEDLELYDESNTTLRPLPTIAIEQLYDFASFCITKLVCYPKFFLVSPLTLRHLMNESVRNGVVLYSSPMLVDLGDCPIMTELTIRGIPVIDQLPVHYQARQGWEIPHFIAGIGIEGGVYYLTAVLNPEIGKIPQINRGLLESRKNKAKLNSEFNNLAKGRKSKAGWNF